RQAGAGGPCGQAGLYLASGCEGLEREAGPVAGRDPLVQRPSLDRRSASEGSHRLHAGDTREDLPRPRREWDADRGRAARTGRQPRAGEAEMSAEALEAGRLRPDRPRFVSTMLICSWLGPDDRHDVRCREDVPLVRSIVTPI